GEVEPAVLRRPRRRRVVPVVPLLHDVRPGAVLARHRARPPAAEAVQARRGPLPRHPRGRRARRGPAPLLGRAGRRDPRDKGLTASGTAYENVRVTRVVRFFFDHGHPWPLWEDGSEKYTTDPGDYGLSDDLA